MREDNENYNSNVMGRIFLKLPQQCDPQLSDVQYTSLNTDPRSNDTTRTQ